MIIFLLTRITCWFSCFWFAVALLLRLCTFWTKSVLWRTRCFSGLSSKALISPLRSSSYVSDHVWTSEHFHCIVYWVNVPTCFYLLQVTRLLPDAVGTTCGQRLEKVIGTEHTDIIRVPFRNENGILRKWISRFDVWPYLETYTEVYRLNLFYWMLHRI